LLEKSEKRKNIFVPLTGRDQIGLHFSFPTLHVPVPASLKDVQSNGGEAGGEPMWTTTADGR